MNSGSGNGKQNEIPSFSFEDSFSSKKEDTPTAPKKEYSLSSFKNEASLFENFIKRKDLALSSFIRFVPAEVRDNLIDPKDVNDVKIMFENKGRFITVMMISSALFSFYFDRFLRFKSVIYGLTYRWTLIGFICKYFLFPQFVTSNTINFYYDPKFKSSYDSILNKYDMDNNAFKEAYELYVKNKLFPS